MTPKDKKITSTQFLNENIPFSQVLLVIDKEEKEIIDRQEALQRAKNLGLDLFCVAPDKNPPVCKLINYQKYIFELSKKKKDKKENVCKEVRISLNIGEKDLKDKLERVNKWTEKGWLAKISVVMVGKQKIRPELAQEKCQKIIAELKTRSPKIELKDNIRRHLNTFYFFLYKKKQ
ncbi:MAG: translation initiation factor IF-3 [Mycoplasmataceae bacterium RV_VA103A]|nr:MAG: translation initiation factor IF-3 [Mycoplasmataceae bacterium RV_VA103A]